MEKQVLQKYIASSGFCSRRKAEELVSLGRVFVNDEKAELGIRVDDTDTVMINGEKIKAIKEKIYIKFHKPENVTCTSASFKNEKNVFDFLPPEYDILHIVGRLDKDSTGLVVLTNDGELTQSVTHPSFEHEKKYLVTLQNNKERNKDDIIKKFINGIEIAEDGVVRAKKIKFLGENVFEVVLTEGKKRQIRRMFGEMGERVTQLKRISIGEIELGDLKEGEWEKFEIN